MQTANIIDIHRLPPVKGFYREARLKNTEIVCYRGGAVCIFVACQIT